VRPDGTASPRRRSARRAAPGSEMRSQVPSAGTSRRSALMPPLCASTGSIAARVAPQGSRPCAGRGCRADRVTVFVVAKVAHGRPPKRPWRRSRTGSHLGPSSRPSMANSKFARSRAQIRGQILDQIRGQILDQIWGQSRGQSSSQGADGAKRHCVAWKKPERSGFALLAKGCVAP